MTSSAAVNANKLTRDTQLKREADKAEGMLAQYRMSGLNSYDALRSFRHFYGEIRTLSVLRPTGAPRLAPITARLPRVNVRGYCESLWFRSES